MSLLDRFSMVGHVAVVTGSGHGIGRGIAWGLADADCDLVLNARRRGDLETTASGVTDRGRRALIVEWRHPRRGGIAVLGGRTQRTTTYKPREST
ncbi:MAG: SDR family NAD(P)-dependent oxidoreductase [Acidimicrobiia bacterium]|nr:SDR family NAD(P)-dependent oxidoreductase [Acidimicrobiia bacterium]